jgi:hypothetical protein
MSAASPDERAGRDDSPSGASLESEPGSPRRRALEWLHPRLDGMHPELAAAIRRCVREGPVAEPESAIADVLADAAAAELTRISEGSQDRAAAVRLLAADAVLTFAFEAVATGGGDPDSLADRVGLRGTLGRALLAARDREEATE